MPGSAVDILKPTQQGQKRYGTVVDGVHIGATWRIGLDRSACGGDVALRQITLTTCHYYV